MSAAGELVIFESPARAKTFEQSAGPSCHGPAGIGHLGDPATNWPCGVAR